MGSIPCRNDWIRLTAPIDLISVLVYLEKLHSAFQTSSLYMHKPMHPSQMNLQILYIIITLILHMNFLGLEYFFHRTKTYWEDWIYLWNTQHIVHFSTHCRLSTNVGQALCDSNFHSLLFIEFFSCWIHLFLILPPKIGINWIYTILLFC